MSVLWPWGAITVEDDDQFDDDEVSELEPLSDFESDDDDEQDE